MTPVLYQPETMEEACELLAAEEGSMVYGGGTAIQILLKQGLLFAPAFVDISRIAGLSDIDVAPDGIRVGPMVTIRRMETDPLVATRLPLVASAYGKVANARVRNTARVGGNLAHGDYRLDPPVALLALEAAVELTSSQGRRRVAARDFFVDFQLTDLQPGEIVTAIEIRAADPPEGSCYVKLSSLSANDWPAASAAAAIYGRADQRILRVAIGALAPIPRRAELHLAGDTCDDAVEAALTAAEELMDPIPDVRGGADYKRRLGRVAVEDAVRGAWKEAEGA